MRSLLYQRHLGSCFPHQLLAPRDQCLLVIEILNNSSTPTSYAFTADADSEGNYTVWVSESSLKVIQREQDVRIVWEGEGDAREQDDNNPNSR